MLVREKFNPDDYEFYVKEYVRKSEEANKPITHAKLRKDPYNLPDARWYINNCPNKDVKSWADFVDWCGFIVKGKTPSKEKVIQLIYKMQSQVDRPLMYDDFRGNGCYHVHINTIKKYWKNMNEMKKDLGLEIVQDSMVDKHLDKNGFDNEIQKILNYLKNENRNFMTTRELDDNSVWQSYTSLDRLSKKFYNCSITTYLSSYGISFGDQGIGLCNKFDDGETTNSQFEYLFSSCLKKYGLTYNIDYFRDVKYSEFIDSYFDNMNCDYVIHVNDKIIYIEIAGIIEDYKSWYYQNKSIDSSKSKEKYRLKLQQKEKMLKENGLIYFVLFPCDLTEENIVAILEDGSLELRKTIEKFKQHNIDWVKIRENGGKLDYSRPFFRNVKPQKIDKT